MLKEERRPELIVIAGPNGSGKTSVTQKFLHHEWASGTVYINPDQIANDKFGDWNSHDAVLKGVNNASEIKSVLCSRLFSPLKTRLISLFEQSKPDFLSECFLYQQAILQ